MTINGTPPDTAVFDIVARPVDTNYHRALAWCQAFRQIGLSPG